MKKFLLLCALAVGSFAYSASLTWAAESFSSSYNSGTVYLVQVATANYADSSAIVSALTGSTYAAFSASTGVTKLQSVTNSSTALDYWDVDGDVIYTKGTASGITLSSDVLVYIIIASDDATKYLVSDTGLYPNLDASGSIYSGITFSSWTEVNNAPEPTVLALLALGVAGMALKRRV